MQLDQQEDELDGEDEKDEKFSRNKVLQAPSRLKTELPKVAGRPTKQMRALTHFVATTKKKDSREVKTTVKQKKNT